MSNFNKYKLQNLQFSDKMKKEIKALEPTPEEIRDAIQAFVFSDYKLSFSFNSRGDSYVLSFTSKNAERSDYQMVFTAHHARLSALFRILVWLVDKAKDGKDFESIFGIQQAEDW